MWVKKKWLEMTDNKGIIMKTCYLGNTEVKELHDRYPDIMLGGGGGRSNFVF